MCNMVCVYLLMYGVVCAVSMQVPGFLKSLVCASVRMYARVCTCVRVSVVPV